MKRMLIAAGLAIAALAAPGLRSDAADLNYRHAPADRYGSAYEDPRYADLYGEPPPRYVEPPRRYGYGYGQPPIPKEPVYRDDYRPYPPRYAEAPPPHIYSYRPDVYGRHGCASREEVRQDLFRQGWRDLRDAEVADRGTAFVRARRPDGRPFELKVDRCSGEVLAARPLYSDYGPYAQGERRWLRSY
jgi:hypothetical protein